MCVGVPRHQKYESKYVRDHPAVTMAETLIYKGALLQLQQKKPEFGEKWKTSKEGGPVLYKRVRDLRLPLLKRVVNSMGDNIAKVQTFGLSYTRKGGPILRNSSRETMDLIQDINLQLQKVSPNFTYTSLQIICNGRALLHVDKNNVGDSMSIALGPFCGGSTMHIQRQEWCTRDHANGSVELRRRSEAAPRSAIRGRKSGHCSIHTQIGIHGHGKIFSRCIGAPRLPAPCRIWYGASVPANGGSLRRVSSTSGISLRTALR